MPFDPSSLFDTSHFATFLGGAAIGSAGQYLADRYTDRRREQEKMSHEKRNVAKLNELMPQLFQDLAEKLKSDQSGTIREFIVLKNRTIPFWESKPRYLYYESERPNLINQFSLLVEAGYAQNVSVGNIPIFRLREEFVLHLKEQ